MKPLGVFDVGSDIKSSGRIWPMANLEPVQTSQDYSFGLCVVWVPIQMEFIEEVDFEGTLVGGDVARPNLMCERSGSSSGTRQKWNACRWQQTSNNQDSSMFWI